MKRADAWADVDYLIGIPVMLAIGAVCFKAAQQKGRNPWVWGVVGALTMLLGLLFVLFLPRREHEPAS